MFYNMLGIKNSKIVTVYGVRFRLPPPAPKKKVHYFTKLYFLCNKGKMNLYSGHELKYETLLMTRGGTRDSLDAAS